MKHLFSFLNPKLTHQPDIALATAFLLVFSTILIPLPANVLDLLLAINLALALIVLVSALIAAKAIHISSFPSLLLLSTFFRLALNISSTRIILSSGGGSAIVKAFADVTVQDDLAVGLVMFFMLIIVQFVVVSKGAERIAEIGARFTLDALPGKQMSIDAAWRAGSIDEAEANKRRQELGTESQFFGAMDGAMKFVKGDTIAGLIMTAVNLLAGFAVGVLRDGHSLREAATTYGNLAVGDGLVAQVPALLTTLAAGFLVTKVARGQKQESVGHSIADELFSDYRPPIAVAGIFLIFATIPNFPGLVFMLIGAICGAFGLRRYLVQKQTQLPNTQQLRKHKFEQQMNKQAKSVMEQNAVLDSVAPAAVPITIRLGSALSRELGFSEEHNQAAEALTDRLAKMREHLFLEIGVRFPGTRIVPFAKTLDAEAFELCLRDVPMLSQRVGLDSVLCFESPEDLQRLGIEAKANPQILSGHVTSRVDKKDLALLEKAQIKSLSAEDQIIFLLGSLLKRKAADFLGPQECSELVAKMKIAYPALVDEVLPKLINFSTLSEILKRLASEGVSIRDLKSILECLAASAQHESDSVALTERVRAALSCQIAHQHAGICGKLYVLLLDEALQETIRAAIVRQGGLSYLALEPELRRSALKATAKKVKTCIELGQSPIVLTDAGIRRYVYTLFTDELPGLSVLSYQELPPHMVIQPLGKVDIEDALSVAA